MAEFIFTLKTIPAEGIERCSRYLVARDAGFRLKISIFQIRYDWNYCKPDRILSLFNSVNKKAVESWVKANAMVTEEGLVEWLKDNFDLALG